MSVLHTDEVVQNKHLAWPLNTSTVSLVEEARPTEGTSTLRPSNLQSTTPYSAAIGTTPFFLNTATHPLPPDAPPTILSPVPQVLIECSGWCQGDACR